LDPKVEKQNHFRHETKPRVQKNVLTLEPVLIDYVQVDKHNVKC